jgi:hypothetical protein
MRKITIRATILALTALVMAVTSAMAGERFGAYFDGGLSQSFKQETESGDVDQSFEVSCGGDNAKQCVNVSGASNTGNVQDASPALSRSTLPSTNSSRRTLAPTLQLMADPM